MAAHRYWRLYVESVNSSSPTYCTIVEMELRESAGGPDITTPDTVVSASSSYPTGPVRQIVDNVLSDSSNWTTVTSDVDINHPCWVLFDLGVPRSVAEIWFKVFTAVRAPKRFYFQGSDDGVTFPTLVQLIPDQTDWSSLTKTIRIDFSHVSGNAKLDTGAAASIVQVFDWLPPYSLFATSVPSVDGDWDASAMAGGGDVLIVIRGPSGYQPVAHGPVRAVVE